MWLDFIKSYINLRDSNLILIFFLNLKNILSKLKNEIQFLFLNFEK